MSSHSVELTPEARGDITAIFQYTSERWGEQQADHYEQQLLDALTRLGQFPEIGKIFFEGTLGLVRALPVAEHVLYYLIDDEQVTVLRILRTRMDASSVLDS